MTINQSAVQIHPVELAIIKSRTKPEAIAARAIVRDAAGHKYWERFSEDGKAAVEKDAKAIYAALYKPPLPDQPRTEELPIAGYGYGADTLPVIYALVSIANNLTVVDASKSKQKITVEKQPPVDEPETLRTVANMERLCRRLTGTHPSSFGFHPAVYFYSSTMKHQPTAVLAVAQLVMDLEAKNRLYAFTDIRSRFEDFLVSHKMYMNQLTSKFGSKAKGFLRVRDYYELVLTLIAAGKTEEEIEIALREDKRFETLVKEKLVLTTQAKEFSTNAKMTKLMAGLLEAAFRCDICGARADKKSMQLGHTKDKKDGGLATLDNSAWEHPFCNSTYKPYLQKHVAK